MQMNQNIIYKNLKVEKDTYLQSEDKDSSLPFALGGSGQVSLPLWTFICKLEIQSLS